MLARFVFLILGFVSIVISCKKPTVEKPNVGEYQEEYSGGDATYFDESSEAFNHSAPGLSDEDKSKFKGGNSSFRTNWVAAGNSTTARDGLGPFINSQSCSGCHFDDGRGLPDINKGLLFRLSIPGKDLHGNTLPDPNYGGQLSTRAIFGIKEEGTVDILYQEITAQYADGEVYNLRKPVYTLNGLNYGSIDPNIRVSPRVGPQVYGLGLLEAITSQTIEALADENDQNKDGISGRPNYVWDYAESKLAIGKFGWKANQPNLRQQVAGAFNGDMGLTTSLFGAENLSGLEISTYRFDTLKTGGNPEVVDKDFNEVVFYQQLLAVPARRDWQNPDVLAGKKLFNDLKCNACHIPSLKTGYSPVTQLSMQTIRPYTDLLLHDMGTDLSDNRTDFLAEGNEWRTPPLWGIGLIRTVNKHTFLLHDGRARNLSEAILWHAGEAENSKNSFKNLSKQDRQHLILFLESL